MRTSFFLPIFLLVAAASFVAADSAGVQAFTNILNIAYNASSQIQPEVTSLMSGQTSFNAATASINLVTQNTIKELQTAVMTSAGPLLGLAVTLLFGALGAALGLILPVSNLILPLLAPPL